MKELIEKKFIGKKFEGEFVDDIVELLSSLNESKYLSFIFDNSYEEQAVKLKNINPHELQDLIFSANELLSTLNEDRRKRIEGFQYKLTKKDDYVEKINSFFEGLGKYNKISSHVSNIVAEDIKRFVGH